MFLVIIILYSTLFCVLRRCASFLCVCVCVPCILRNFLAQSALRRRSRRSISVFLLPLSPFHLLLRPCSFASQFTFTAAAGGGGTCLAMAFFTFLRYSGYPFQATPFRERERVWHTLCQCHATRRHASQSLGRTLTQGGY